MKLIGILSAALLATAPLCATGWNRDERRDYDDFRSNSGGAAGDFRSNSGGASGGGFGSRSFSGFSFGDKRRGRNRRDDDHDDDDNDNNNNNNNNNVLALARKRIDDLQDQVLTWKIKEAKLDKATAECEQRLAEAARSQAEAEIKDEQLRTKLLKLRNDATAMESESKEWKASFREGTKVNEESERKLSECRERGETLEKKVGDLEGEREKMAEIAAGEIEASKAKLENARKSRETLEKKLRDDEEKADHEMAKIRAELRDEKERARLEAEAYQSEIEKLEGISEESKAKLEEAELSRKEMEKKRDREDWNIPISKYAQTLETELNLVRLRKEEMEEELRSMKLQKKEMEKELQSAIREILSVKFQRQEMEKEWLC